MEENKAAGRMESTSSENPPLRGAAGVSLRGGSQLGGAVRNHKSEQPHVLACTEGLGGYRKITRKVKLPGLLGWVGWFRVVEEERGGGVHYLSVCDYDWLFR